MPEFPANYIQIYSVKTKQQQTVFNIHEQGEKYFPKKTIR